MKVCSGIVIAFAAFFVLGCGPERMTGDIDLLQGQVERVANQWIGEMDGADSEPPRVELPSAPPAYAAPIASPPPSAQNPAPVGPGQIVVEVQSDVAVVDAHQLAALREPSWDAYVQAVRGPQVVSEPD